MKSQAATEYLLIIGFVTFVLAAIVFLAYFYTGMSTYAIKQNQLEVSINKIISSSESIYYSGKQSQTKVSTYFPPGVRNVTISGKSIIVEMASKGEVSKRVFNSKVNMTGNLDFRSGMKEVIIKASSSGVSIS